MSASPPTGRAYARCVTCRDILPEEYDRTVPHVCSAYCANVWIARQRAHSIAPLPRFAVGDLVTGAAVGKSPAVRGLQVVSMRLVPVEHSTETIGPYWRVLATRVAGDNPIHEYEAAERFFEPTDLAALDRTYLSDPVVVDVVVDGLLAGIGGAI